MIGVRAAVLVASAALSAGCISMTHSMAKHLPDPVPRPAEGLFVHAPSGMEVPERVGPFTRAEVFRYDAEGLDVSAGYNARFGSFPLIATVYVYPGKKYSSFLKSEREVERWRRQHEDRDYRGERDGILRYEREETKREASLVLEEEFAMELGGATRAGRRAELEIVGAVGLQGAKCTSLLYWFPRAAEGWIVKYRVTFLKASSMPEKGLQTLLEGVPWPPGNP